jgi:hypothetical protein
VHLTRTFPSAGATDIISMNGCVHVGVNSNTIARNDDERSVYQEKRRDLAQESDCVPSFVVQKLAFFFCFSVFLS